MAYLVARVATVVVRSAQKPRCSFRIRSCDGSAPRFTALQIRARIGHKNLRIKLQRVELTTKLLVHRYHATLSLGFKGASFD
jgi:hypothetical protein